MAYMSGDCLSSSVSIQLRCFRKMTRECAHGTKPDGGGADGRLEIVERHAVLADSWGQ